MNEINYFVKEVLKRPLGSVLVTRRSRVASASIWRRLVTEGGCHTWIKRAVRSSATNNLTGVNLFWDCG